MRRGVVSVMNVLNQPPVMRFWWLRCLEGSIRVYTCGQSCVFSRLRLQVDLKLRVVLVRSAAVVEEVAGYLAPRGVVLLGQLVDVVGEVVVDPNRDRPVGHG